MIKIELLTAENFKPDSLDNYQRRQKQNRVTFKCFVKFNVSCLVVKEGK